MNPHLAKVKSEPRLKELPRPSIQRLARSAQHFVYRRWSRRAIQPGRASG
jgi:histone H3/H4